MKCVFIAGRSFLCKIKYLRRLVPHNNGSRHSQLHTCSSQFSFRDTIFRRVCTILRESSRRDYNHIRVLILARNSRVLSSFLFVSMVIHVGHTRAWRAYRDVCDEVASSLSLPLSMILSDWEKLYLQLLRSDFL